MVTSQLKFSSEARAFGTFYQGSHSDLYIVHRDFTATVDVLQPRNGCKHWTKLKLKSHTAQLTFFMLVMVWVFGLIISCFILKIMSSCSCICPFTALFPAPPYVPLVSSPCVFKPAFFLYSALVRLFLSFHRSLCFLKVLLPVSLCYPGFYLF